MNGVGLSAMMSASDVQKLLMGPHLTHVPPNPEIRNLEPDIRNPKLETRNLEPETRNPNFETRNPEPETRNLEPVPETRNPKPETRNPKPETRSSRKKMHGGHVAFDQLTHFPNLTDRADSGGACRRVRLRLDGLPPSCLATRTPYTPKPETQTTNHEPQTPNLKPQAPSPNPQTPNPKPQTSPKPQTPNPKPQTPLAGSIRERGKVDRARTLAAGVTHYRGTSLIRKSPPPQGRHRGLGILLL